jgi:predicted phage terminase large subunit-like protein
MKNRIISQLARLRKEAGSKSVYAFACLYMKHHMEFVPSPAHVAIYDLLNTATNERGKKIAIAAPRDFGKSTLITLIHVLYCMCYNKEGFIVVISNTMLQSNRLFDNIRKEITENKILREDFPEVFESTLDNKRMRWRESDIVTHNNVKVMALSSGQQIRGCRFGATRPSLVIADDLEDAENTFSLEKLDKRRQWYEKSVLKVGSERTNYIFLGNLYHPHSLLSEFIRPDMNTVWIKKIYSALVDWPKDMIIWDKWNNIYCYREQFESDTGPAAARKYYEQNKLKMDEGAHILWPSRYKIYDLMSMWAENEISFLSEMQNLPRNPANCIFDIDKIVYWDQDGKSVDDLIKSIGDNVKIYIACDPSLGLDTVKGDPSAIVVLAKDWETKKLYVIEADVKRRPVEETVETIIAYYLKYKPVKIAIEGNQFQRRLINMVKDASKPLSLYPPIESLINTENKISRIQSLRPLMLSGNLQFSMKHRQLLEEIRYFPKGRHDDSLDALEMAVRISNDNGFMFWFGGDARRGILGGGGSRMLPQTLPADGSLVPYGYYSRHPKY